MQRQRTSLDTAINTTVAIVMVYLVSVLVSPWPIVGFGLFGLAIAATAWVALRILKDPQGTEKSFEDQFYQDRDDIRRCKLT